MITSSPISPLLHRSYLLIVLLTIFILAVVVNADDSEEQSTLINLPGYASIIGTQSSSQSCNVYWGLPYAQAARWDIPHPPTDWIKQQTNTTFPATHPGPGCPQTCRLDPFASLTCPSDLQSEQCLNLNVFTPNQSQLQQLRAKHIDIKNLPVMVFIHGGSFTSGYSASPIYNPEYIVSTYGVIVVTINYRLGLLGQLYNPELNITGNYWLYDQQYALAWVQTFIPYFGGSPQHITLAGHSAGAVSLFYHQTYTADAMYYSTILPDMQNLLPCDQGNDDFSQTSWYDDDDDDDDDGDSSKSSPASFFEVLPDTRLSDCDQQHPTANGPTKGGGRLQMQQRVLLRQYLRDLYKLGYNLPQDYIPSELVRNDTHLEELDMVPPQSSINLPAEQLDILRDIYNLNALLAVSLDDLIVNSTSTAAAAAQPLSLFSRGDRYFDESIHAHSSFQKWHNIAISDILAGYASSPLPMLQLHANRYVTWSVCNRRRAAIFAIQRQKCGPSRIEGYFSQILSFSPPMALPPSTPPNARIMNEKLLQITHCNNPHDHDVLTQDNNYNTNATDILFTQQRDCLLGLSTDTISARSLLHAIEEHNNTFGSLLETYDQFGPTCRTLLLPRYHYEFINGVHAIYGYRPAIIGTTSDEANLFTGGTYSHDSWWPTKSRQYNITADTLRVIIPQIFPNGTYQTTRLDELLTFFGLDIYSDRVNASAFSTSSLLSVASSSSSSSSFSSSSPSSSSFTISDTNATTISPVKDYFQSYSTFATNLIFTCPTILATQNLQHPREYDYSNYPNIISLPGPIELFPPVTATPSQDEFSLSGSSSRRNNNSTTPIISTTTLQSTNGLDVTQLQQRLRQLHTAFTTSSFIDLSSTSSSSSSSSSSSLANLDDDSDSLELGSSASLSDLLLLQAPLGAPIWTYLSSHPLTIYHSLSALLPQYCADKVCHGYDLFLHFFSLPGLVNSTLIHLLSEQTNTPLYTIPELQLAGQMSQYYANFLFHGNPNIVSPGLRNVLSTPYFTAGDAISPYRQDTSPIDQLADPNMRLQWPLGIDQDKRSSDAVSPHTAWIVWAISPSANGRVPDDSGHFFNLNNSSHLGDVYTNFSVVSTSIVTNYAHTGCDYAAAVGMNWAFPTPQLYSELGLPVHTLLFSILGLILAIVIIVALIGGAIVILVVQCGGSGLSSLFSWRAVYDREDEDDEDLEHQHLSVNGSINDSAGVSRRFKTTIVEPVGVQLADLNSAI